MSNFIMTAGAQTILGAKTFTSAPVFQSSLSIISGYREYCYQDTSLSSADILALNTTPITIVSQPGAGFTVIPLGVLYHVHAGGTNYGNLTSKFFLVSFANGTIIGSSVTASSLLAQSGSAKTRWAGPYVNLSSNENDYRYTDNQAIVVRINTGNPTTGTSTMAIRAFYKVVASSLP